ncbi:hypothetical protein LOKVESSMR4R_03690 [Yoonia vestfoldensis]|uniref:Uncharacterized protein n=1 Tax=Yoonia vestfoldensis TaxID=245188 RepID=A0A1Y0EH47_9RHOB|nr:hypothetical protein LOKVESSMR4R_03690 [Yoonia vestfoldensis]
MVKTTLEAQTKSVHYTEINRLRGGCIVHIEARSGSTHRFPPNPTDCHRLPPTSRTWGLLFSSLNLHLRTNPVQAPFYGDLGAVFLRLFPYFEQGAATS